MCIQSNSQLKEFTNVSTASQTMFVGVQWKLVLLKQVSLRPA